MLLAARLRRQVRSALSSWTEWSVEIQGDKNHGLYDVRF
jgi:hypothetical protein